MRSKLTLKQKLELLAEGFGLYLKNRRAGTLPTDAKSSDPNALWNFYMFKRPLAYVPMAIGALIALYAPLNVMDQLAWLKPLPEWLRSVFLPMDGYIRRSAFPQVTELYFLVMTLHSPVHFYYMRKLLNVPENVEARRKSWQRSTLGQKLFVALIFLPMSVAIVGFTLTLNDGFDFRSLPFNASRVALAIAGWVISGPGSFAVAALVSVIATDILSGKINKATSSTQREHRE